MMKAMWGWKVADRKTIKEYGGVEETVHGLAPANRVIW